MARRYWNGSLTRYPERSLDPPDCDCGACEDCIRLEEEAEEREYWLECKADAERDDRLTGDRD